MELQKLKKGPVESAQTLGLEGIEERVFAGSVNEKEVLLAQSDPVCFLKAAGVDVADDADIHVSVEHISVAKGRQVKSGLLCRVSILCIGRFCIIRIVCIPVIVIQTPTCW